MQVQRDESPPASSSECEKLQSTDVYLELKVPGEVFEAREGGRQESFMEDNIRFPPVLDGSPGNGWEEVGDEERTRRQDSIAGC